jgi:ABC-type transporter Mla maintaining outer membrane lipid asymmetry ATPase subunit MlaF
MLLGGKVAADGTFEELERSPDRRVQHFLKGQYDRSDDAALTAKEIEGKRQNTLQ